MMSAKNVVAWKVAIARLLTAALVAVGAAQTAGAADAIRTVKGTVNGEIASMTALEVQVKKADGKSEAVAANNIRTIKFDGEPPKVDQARRAAAAGRYADCLKMLDELAEEKFDRDELRDDLAYYRALCLGRLALAGAGNTREAGKVVREFADGRPNNFHQLAARELLGDLLLAVGAHDQALKQYEQLEQAPWDDYKMRAAIAKGGVLKAQKKFPEALAAYERVLELSAQNPGKGDAAELVQAQRLTATLGKVECLTESGQSDAAVELVQKVIADAPAEDAELHARAYNALGDSLKRAGRNKEALLAYLHVDVLYSAQPQAHAEALRHLAELWTAVNQPERAAQALQTLQDRYQAK